MKKVYAVLDALDGLKTKGDYLDVLNLMRELFGLSNIAYQRFTKDRTAFVTYDEEWVSRYNNKKYYIIDPVVRSCSRFYLPYCWDNLDRSSVLMKGLFKEAESFGVGSHGISFPVRDSIGIQALFSITKHCTNKEWVSSKRELCVGFHLISHAFHQNATTLLNGPLTSNRLLSSREEQCISLFAQGRKPKEIAYSLSLSLTSVRNHLHKGTRKLGCNSLIEAAMLYSQDQYICTEPKVVFV